MLVSWCSPGLESSWRDFRFRMHISRLTSKLNGAAPKSYQWRHSDGHEPTGPASLALTAERVDQERQESAAPKLLGQTGEQVRTFLSHPPLTSLLFNTTSGWTFLLVVLMCVMLRRTPAFASRVAWLPWWKIRQHGGLVSAGKNRKWYNAAGIGGAETGRCLEGRMCLQILSFDFSSSHTGKRRTSFGQTMMVWQEREKEAQNKGNQRNHLSWRCLQVHLKKLEYQLKGQYFLPFTSERGQHLPEMMGNVKYFKPLFVDILMITASRWWKPNPTL